MTCNGLEFTFFPTWKVCFRVSFASRSRHVHDRVDLAHAISFALFFREGRGKCSKKFMCSMELRGGGYSCKWADDMQASKKGERLNAPICKFVHTRKERPVYKATPCKHYIRSYIRAGETRSCWPRTSAPLYAQLKYMYNLIIDKWMHTRQRMY